MVRCVCDLYRRRHSSSAPGNIDEHAVRVDVRVTFPGRVMIEAADDHVARPVPFDAARTVRTVTSPSAATKASARSTALRCAASIAARCSGEPAIQRTETDFPGVRVQSWPAQWPEPAPRTSGLPVAGWMPRRDRGTRPRRSPRRGARRCRRCCHHTPPPSAR